MRLVLLPKGLNEWVVRRLKGESHGEVFGINGDVWNTVRPDAVTATGTHASALAVAATRVACCTDAGSEENAFCIRNLKELFARATTDNAKLKVSCFVFPVSTK